MATSNATAVSERSPPDSSDSRLIFLPGGLASTSTPVVSMSSGSVSTRRPSPPGKSTRKTSSNSRAVSAYASAKTDRIRSSTSLTTVSRSRRVFLRSSSWSERNLYRSSSAANSSSAKGLTLPSRASSRSPFAARFSCMARSYGAGSGAGLPAASAAARSAALGGTGTAGPYSAMRVSTSSPYSSPALASSCSMRSRCSARATSSRCTSLVNRSSSACRRRAAVRTSVSSASRADRPCATTSRRAAAVARETAMADSAYSAPAATALAIAAPRSRVARRWHQGCHLVALHSGRISLQRGGLGELQPLLKLGQRFQASFPGVFGLLLGGGQALGLGLGRTRGGAQLGQAPGGGVALPLGVLASGRGRVDLLLGGVGVGPRTVELAAQGAEPRLGVDALGAGLLDCRLDLDEAGLLARAAGRREGADHVAVGRDRAQRWSVADNGSGGGQVGGEDHVAQGAAQGRPQVFRRLDQVERPPGAVRKDGTVEPAVLARVGRGDEQRGPAGVLPLEQLDC